MRSIIVLALFASVVLAAPQPSGDGWCKDNCVEDCMVGGGRDERDSCMMVFGIGPQSRPGWYSAHDSSRDNLRTCRESCKTACENLCPGEGHNEQEDEGRINSKFDGNAYKDLHASIRYSGVIGDEYSHYRR